MADSARSPDVLLNMGASVRSFPDKQESAPNLAQQAYAHLKGLILAKQILSGTGLSEGRLATELAVSRTPMREALVRLAGEGLLEKSEAGVYRVRSVSVREFFECMELREVLECHALARAIVLVTDEQLAQLDAELKALPHWQDDDMAHWTFDNRFHAFFANAAGNRTLARTIQNQRIVARLFRISSPLHRSAENDEEHQQIMDAVMRRDLAQAQQAMRRHLNNLQVETRGAIEREAYILPRMEEFE